MPKFADTSGYSPEEFRLWDILIENQDKAYYTYKGLEFHYRIAGNEMFVDRKKKSITRACINKAYRQAVELKTVEGPKKLGVFGASYIFPIFLSLGICTPAGRSLRMFPPEIDREQNG